jgi:hypothetical protein
MKCPYCNGECCYLSRREGTIRYAQILTHGKGIHFCKYCEDGNKKEIKEQTCSFCDGKGECDFCLDGKDRGLI